MHEMHEKRSSQETYICDKCEDQFTLENELESHIRETHITKAKVKNTLLLGDSNSKFQNPRLIEKALGGIGLFTPGVTHPRTGRAYCSTRDWPHARYPENNIMDKAVEQLSLREHSFLIFGAPLNDISNIGETQSTEEQYKLAIKSSENCIRVADITLKEFPMLEKVVITEHLPRADALSDLSEFSNFVLRSLVEKSKLKSRIIVAPMDYLQYTNDNEIEDIFGSTSSPAFDGVYLKGRLGGQLYNDCLVAAVRSADIYNRKERQQRQQGISTSNRYSQLN